jgi:translocation and assembly module TamB
VVAAAPPGASVLTAREDDPPRPGPGVQRMREVGDTLDVVSHGLSAVSNALVRGSAAFLHRLRHLDEPPPPGQPPTYFEANLSLNDVDIGELVRRAKIVLPFSVAGKLSFNMTVGFPVDTPRDFGAYRFQGEARLPRLIVAGFEMANVRTRVRYANGELVLEELHAETPFSGWFDGTARYRLVPPGDLSATLRLDRIPVSEVRRLVPSAPAITGDLSGTIQLRAPDARLRDPASWQLAALLHGNSLTVAGLTLKAYSATINALDGSAELKNLQGDLEGAKISARGTVRLVRDYAFEGNVDLPGLDLSFLKRTDPGFRPPVSMRGRLDLTTNLKGTLRPSAIEVSGTARSAELVVDTSRITSLTFRYALAASRVSISDLRAEICKGTVTGSAILPLRAAEGGEVSLRIDRVDVGALAKNVPALPVSLDGAVSGSVAVKLLGVSGDRPRDTVADVELNSPDLRVQGIPTRRVRGSLMYRNGAGSYKLECELAGGTFKLEGPIAPQADSAPTPTAPRPAPGGSQSGIFQLRDVSIGRLLTAGSRGRATSPLQGSLSVDLPFRLEGAGRRPAGSGLFVVSGVRWGDSVATDRLQGELRLGPEGLSASDVNATLGGGAFRFSAGYGFARAGRAYLNIELFHVDAAQLLRPFPALAGLVDGPVDVNLRVSGAGRDLRGGGMVLLPRGRVLGVDVTDLRVPLDLVFMPGVGGQLDIRDSSAQFARGRAQGRVGLAWGDSTRLDGSVRFFDVDLRTLLGRDSEAAGYAGGQLSGSLEFGAENLRSAEDLNANLSATLRQARAADVPIVDQLVPFMGSMGGTGATRFQGGEIIGRLSRGIFRIQHFTLNSSIVQLILEGDVTLAGRLSIEVTAGAGYLGNNSRGFQVLGLRIPAIGALPFALIVDASVFLASRVLHFRVSGTYANPVVRVEPTALLSEESIRFFFSRSSPP